MRLTSIESYFHPCNIYRDCTRGVPREAKMYKNLIKWRTFELTDWITGKRLKIDGTCCDAFDKQYILFSSMCYRDCPMGIPRGGKSVPRLIAETDARSVGDSHPSCWVMLRTKKCTYWLCDLDLWPFNPKIIPFSGYPKVIPYTEFEHFAIFRFRVTYGTGQTNRQINRQTWTFYPRRSTLSAWVVTHTQ